MSTKDLRNRRLEYDADSLLSVPSDPFALFGSWLDEALAAQDQGRPFEASAMTLSTVRRLADGTWRPRARVVLLKEWDEAGFVFYTNLDSDKGREIAANGAVALTFHWAELERQVRIEGCASPVSREQVDAYFASRPRASQTGAWASHQSRPIDSREQLEAAFTAADREFADGEVPTPPFWGGFRVAPERIEFWQGRRSRLHDRIVFDSAGPGWRASRLNP